ncbi:MAG: 2-amino-4-hydroxy-6-hydroxymethyldihydropteridine diphosphokinase [Moheibacter sp.]
MSHNHAVLLLGTNLGNKEKNLSDAKTLIEKRIGTIIRSSIILETEPEGFVSEHGFLNQIFWISTPLSPIGLLKSVKSIESEMGRVYLQKEIYEDRIIDIDLLGFRDLIFESQDLSLPHPQIHTRTFVKKLLLY